MPAIKSAREAIDEFVEAIAQHYVSTKDKGGAKADSVADEFISAIEHDLKSTLRHRLSKLETVKGAEETATVELRASAAVAGQSDPGLLEQTLDTPIDVEAVTILRRPDVAGELPTMDMEVEQSDLGKKPVIRLGKPPQRADLSHDDVPSLDTAKPRRRAAKAPDIPQGYEVLGTLGKGGMGIVYKARHIPLNRLVAVKMIISGEQASEDQLRRFQIEAEAAAHLSHPNIVSVYEVGTHKGLPYFSLEFVDGKSVSEWMRETTLTAKDAAELLIPVARAVHYSHEMGVLHRDLKPQNILLTQDGTPKVADFGLAKRIDNEDAEKTRDGVILGTPGYMAPEQARNSDEIGPHTDVYALGSILYYLMTGRPPFAAPTPFETVRQLLLQEPVAPSRLQSDLDQDLETICLKSLEKEIPKRYATAGEFADELQRFVDGEPIIARPITRHERLWKWCKRNPRVATISAVAASLLLCLLLGGIISAVVINEQKKAEALARRDAEQSSELAEDQADLALGTTRLVLYETQEFFKGHPELRPLREKVLSGILSGVERLHTDRYSNDVGGIFLASADLQLGQIYVDTGVYDKGVDKLLAAQKKLRAVMDSGDLRKAEHSQIKITMALGDGYRGLGELKKAEREYLKLEQQHAAYYEQRPHISEKVKRDRMAMVLGKLASLYRDLGKPDKALDYVLRSVEMRRTNYELRPENEIEIQELAGALSVLSGVYENSGQTEKMIEASSESLRLQLKAAKRLPEHVPSQANIAIDRKRLARQCLLLGNPDRSKKLLTQATESLDRLLEKNSSNLGIVAQAADAHYWLGVAESRLDEDASDSFQRAEQVQRTLMAKSETVNTRGMLLKILARAGKTDVALQIANKMAESPQRMMNCGYAACGYALISEHLESDDPRKSELTTKAIDFSRKLIEHGYHDFEGMRKNDLEFAPLQHHQAFLDMLAEEESKVAKEKERTP